MIMSPQAIRDTLSRLKISVDKHYAALSEPDDLMKIRTIDQEIVTHPFPYIVIDDIFDTETHQRLSAYFKKILARGTVEHNDPSYFHPFHYHKTEHQYDGYLYVPRHDEDPALNFFYSYKWNLFFSKLFSQPTGICTSFALHYHPPGNKTGFVHHDYALRWFSLLNRTENGMVYRERKIPRGLKLIDQVRSIALIYYIDIDEKWTAGSGGETGIYADKHGAPTILVEPKDNRLLAFQISPRSYHAFQANHKHRATFIQWFHTDTSWCVNTYGPVKSIETS